LAHNTDILTESIGKSDERQVIVRPKGATASL